MPSARKPSGASMANDGLALGPLLGRRSALKSALVSVHVLSYDYDSSVYDRSPFVWTMSDPLSITASVLAVSTAAIQAARSLHDAVSRYKGRDKTLRRLQGELADLLKILESLTKASCNDESIFALLRDPIERCSEVCSDFETSMRGFADKSTIGFRDWTRMEFMRGSITDFIETVAGYKSTITVGLGAIAMHNSKVTQQVIEEYNEMIQDTMHELNVQLRRIDARLVKLAPEQDTSPQVEEDLNDEIAVTRQCLKVCEKAQLYIQSLADGTATMLNDASPAEAVDGQCDARIQIDQSLNEAREIFARTSLRLARRLDSLAEDARAGLRADVEISKQCLDLCHRAGEISRQKVYRVGEVLADDNSDQVVVTTLADLFDVGKVTSTNHSLVLVGSMTSEDFRNIVDKRYSSHFRAFPNGYQHVEVPATRPKPNPQLPIDTRPMVVGHSDSQDRRPRQDRPSSNENRKRMPGGDPTGTKEF